MIKISKSINCSDWGEMAPGEGAAVITKSIEPAIEAVKKIIWINPIIML